MTTKLNALALVLFLAVAVIAVNLGARAVLGSAKLDLTEGKLYTLTDASRRIARSAEEPLRLTLFFSRSIAREEPGLLAYGQRVESLLREYASASRGTPGEIRVSVIDPEPFSEAEDQAVAAGIAPIPMSDGRQVYIGLVGTNSTTGQEVIPSLGDVSERFLEYEVSRLISVLAQPERPVVGLLTSLPMGGAPATPTTPARQPWQVFAAMRGLLDVRMLGPDVQQIDDDVDVLMLAHPKGLTDRARFTIDQWVLSGKPAVVLLDPLCEADIPSDAQQNPMALMNADRTSDLPELLEAWGVRMDPGLIAGDLENAQSVQVASRPGTAAEVTRYLPWLDLGPEYIDGESALTGRVSRLMFGTSGYIQPALPPEGEAPAASVTITPLVTTSDETMLLDAERFRFGVQPAQLLSEFASRGEGVTLAALVEGDFVTAFPEGLPGVGEDMLNAGRGRVLLFADADLLADRFWVQSQTMFGQVVGFQRVSDNGDMLISALETLSGNADLVEVRARGRYTRPFTVVQDLRADAEQRYNAEQRELQERLEQTQERILELQSQRPEDDTTLLSDEQARQIEEFQQELIDTRRRLRQVRLELNREVDALGARVKFINIALLPAAVALAAVGLGLARRASAQRDRANVAARERGSAA
ncbi:MAG: Gldg family protein [Planctomycetota bacterium]